MFKIGDFEIKQKVLLAPMAGITSFGYRKFMSQFGPGLCVTEMVSDMGLIYGNEESKSFVQYQNLKMPTGVQLFGNSAENLAKSALICLNLNPNIEYFDINMACPVTKVFKTGAGSALMKDPKLCGDIVRAVKEATHKPVTVKIRIGVDFKHINFMEVIEEVQKAGADMVAIHPRTTKEMYAGLPHWDLLKNLRKKMSVPLVVSGNIFTVEDAINALEITGADAVMVARGGVGNPTLISNINNYFEGKDLESPCINEQIDYCLELARDLIEEKGERIAMRVYRGIATKFLDGLPNSKQTKSRLSTELNTYDDLAKILSEYQHQFDL